MTIKVAGLILSVVAIALLGTGVAFAHGSHAKTAVSGIELSIGRDINGTRVGVVFAGRTNEGDGRFWVKPTPGEGGTWAITLSYTGSAGFPGASANIVGGFWAWTQPDGLRHWGRILSGNVTWPNSIDESLPLDPCGDGPAGGAGVAAFHADISLGLSSRKAGVFAGCLDDIHFRSAEDLPNNLPRIWGSIILR